MNELKKILIPAILLAALFSPLSLQAQSIEFIMVPPKAQQAGKAVDIILPVRILDKKCQYAIETKGSPEYPVEHPSILNSGEAGSEIVYLLFRVQIPSTAPNGQFYQLNAKFTPNEDCQDQNTYTHNMAVKIQALNDLSFTGPSERLEQMSKADNFEVLLKNTGNTNLTLDLNIQNFTSNVRVSVDKRRITVAAGSFAKVDVTVDFSSSGADFASFKLIANSNGQRFFSKNYQVRLVKSAGKRGGQRGLESNFYVTNEFFSEDGNSHSYQNLGASLSGDLSDFYAFSLYAQSNYLRSENESNFYAFDLTKHDEFRVRIGSNLNPLDANVPGIRQLRGIKGEKEFFKDLRIGAYQGEDFEGNNHFGTYVDYNQSYKNRWIVFWDKNTDTGFEAAGVSGEKFFRVSQALAIAPSVALAKDEIRGDYSKIGVSLSALLAQRAPLQMEVAREEDKNYVTASANGSVSIPFKNVNFELGVYAVDRSAKNSLQSGSAGQEDRDSSESYFRILFPVSRHINGQATVRYQTSSLGESGVSPELFLSGSKGNLNGWFRVGRRLSGSPNALALGYDEDLSGNESFAQLDVNYMPLGKYGTYLSADVFKNGVSGDYREEVSWGAQRKVHNEDSFVRIGLRATRFKNFYQEESSYGVDMQYNWQISNNFSLRFEAEVEHLKELDKFNYQANLGIRWTPFVPVSRKVENIFGGKKTGEIQGRVCLDLNENRLCDPSDQYLDGVKIRLGGLVSVSRSGSFEFLNLAPARYVMLVDRETLPAQAAIEYPERDVFINANDRKRIDIALKWSGSAKVIVFEDLNNDGVWQSEQEPQLPNVEVALIGDGVRLQGISSSNRPLVFSSLKRGRYRAKVVNAPANATPSPVEGVNIDIPDNKGNWIYLGLSFGSVGAEDDDIVATLEDNLIFQDDPFARVYVDDPNSSGKFYRYSCGSYESPLSSVEADAAPESYLLEIEIGPCQARSGDAVDLKLELLSNESNVTGRFEFQVFVE